RDWLGAGSSGEFHGADRVGQSPGYRRASHDTIAGCCALVFSGRDQVLNLCLGTCRLGSKQGGSHSFCIGIQSSAIISLILELGGSLHESVIAVVESAATVAGSTELHLVVRIV